VLVNLDTNDYPILYGFYFESLEASLLIAHYYLYLFSNRPFPAIITLNNCMTNSHYSRCRLSYRMSSGFSWTNCMTYNKVLHSSSYVTRRLSDTALSVARALGLPSNSLCFHYAISRIGGESFIPRVSPYF